MGKCVSQRCQKVQEDAKTTVTLVPEPPNKTKNKTTPNKNKKIKQHPIKQKVKQHSAGKCFNFHLFMRSAFCC